MSSPELQAPTPKPEPDELDGGLCYIGNDPSRPGVWLHGNWWTSCATSEEYRRFKERQDSQRV